jgi:RimJ/RimL family protein N-acetyltransferase
MDSPVIRTQRLELVSFSPPFLDALLDARRDEAERLLGASIPDDFPDRHDEGFLRLRLGQLRAEPERQPWLVHGVVLPGPERRLVGHAGFHGPPGINGLRDPDAVEIGYTIFPPHRGLGYATEIAAGLIESARAHGVRRVIASVAPGNAPSLAIVRKLGFVQTGEQWDDEDGLELVFQLETGSG